MKFKYRRFYTNYPFEELGDIEYTLAQSREIELLMFDGNKYIKVLFEGEILELKWFYVSTKKYIGRRWGLRRKIPQHVLNKIEVDIGAWLREKPAEEL